MAPESERAKVCDCGHTQDYHAHPGELGTPCTQCGCMKYSLPWKTLTIDEQFAGMASDEAYQRETRKILGEPTLTCSEVVERLIRLGYDTAWLAYESPRDVKWFRAEAEKVLHSWRERRVQELEEALENFVKLVGDAVLVRNIEDDGDMMKYLRQGTRIVEVLKQADAALANSEWREQIRKGAKHE